MFLAKQELLKIYRKASEGNILPKEIEDQINEINSIDEITD
jgi:hypothetical protein